jgi:hypothetical protein
LPAYYFSVFDSHQLLVEEQASKWVFKVRSIMMVLCGRILTTRDPHVQPKPATATPSHVLGRDDSCAVLNLSPAPLTCSALFPSKPQFHIHHTQLNQYNIMSRFIPWQAVCVGAKVIAGGAGGRELTSDYQLLCVYLI